MVQQDRPARVKPGVREPMLMSALPAACRQVLVARIARSDHEWKTRARAETAHSANESDEADRDHQPARRDIA